MYEMCIRDSLYTDAERLRDTIQSGVDEKEFNRSVMLINDARRLYILGARSAAYLAGLMGSVSYTHLDVYKRQIDMSLPVKRRKLRKSRRRLM